MFALKNKMFILLNALGIVVNAIISACYYLLENVKKESVLELFIINIFLLVGTIVFMLVLFKIERRRRKSLICLFFILIACGFIFCLITSIIKRSIGNEFLALIAYVYLFVNLVYRVFFDSNFR